jgi:hypothetical protein
MEKSPSSNLTPEAQKRLEALHKPYYDEVYGDAKRLSELDKQGLAEQSLEEASAYDRHMEGMAQLPNDDPASEKGAETRRTEFIDQIQDLNNQSSPALERDARMWDEAYEMNNEFDANKIVEAEAHQAAIQAKIDANPQLRRVEMMTRELTELKSSLASLDADEATKQQSHVDDLEDRIQDLLGKYEDAEDFDREVADTLLERVVAEPNAQGEAAPITAAEKSNDSQKTENQTHEEKEVDETDPVAQASDIANSLSDSKVQEALEANPDTAKAVADALTEAQRLAEEPVSTPEDTDNTSDARLKQPTKMPTGPTLTERLESEENGGSTASKEVVLVKSLPSNEVAVRPEDQSKDKADLSDPSIASVDVNGNPLYFNDKFVQRMEQGGSFKRAWGSLREKIANRERGRKGLKVALGMMAGLTMAAGIAGALSGDKAPSENHDVDSGTSASADPSKGTETKPTPPAPTETQSAHDKLLKSEAWNIPQGGGGEQMMNRLHVDKSIWYENEAEFQKKYPGEAYWMQDGHVGLRDPGALPMSAREFWVTKIEQQK